jgi:exosortase A-associated hydrolase 1
MAASVEAKVLECMAEPIIAILHPVPAADVGVVIIVGGPQFRVGSHRQFVLTARGLAAAGISVLRFDVRGMGDSAAPQRSFEDTNADIRCAVDALVAAAPSLRSIALFGLCDGASSSLMYAADDARITHLILANPWVRTGTSVTTVMLRHYYWRRFLQRSFWTKLFSMKLNPFRAVYGLAGHVRLMGRTRTPAEASPGASGYVDRMLYGLERFRGQVLLLLSGQDLTAKEFLTLGENDRRWRRLLRRQSVARVDRPAADHTFSARAELDAVLAECVRWLVRRDVFPDTATTSHAHTIPRRSMDA